MWKPLTTSLVLWPVPTPIHDGTRFSCGYWSGNPSAKSGKSEPERKIPDKHGLQDEKNSSESEVRIMVTENPDYVPRKDSVPEEIVNERQNFDTPAVASTKAKSGFGKIINCLYIILKMIIMSKLIKVNYCQI